MQLEIGECFETLNDALQAAVKALGGYKKVGEMLRPELLADQSGNWLRDCLNPGKRDKLGPEQVLLILRRSREAGFHAAMHFIAFDTGYKAVPVDPESQIEQLQERFCDSVQSLSQMAAKLERMQRMRVAA